jgi:hypothetical protein
VFGDRVACTGRYPLQGSGASTQSASQGIYEDQTGVLDCNKSVYVMAERTVYSSAGEIIFHFKYAEPESLDMSNGLTISPGTILVLAQRLLCDEKLRSLLLSRAQFSNIHLSYLANSADGDGDVFYGPIKPTSNPAYPFEVLLVIKKTGDHDFAKEFPGQNIRGRPSSFHTFAETLQMNCTERKIFVAALEYYDRDDNLVYLAPQIQPMLNYNKASLFENLLDIVCRASALSIAGNYEGMNNATYEKKGRGEQKVSLTIQQNGSDVKVDFQTLGGKGEGTGKLSGDRVEALSLRSTEPNCPGSYHGSLLFADNSVSWSYKGKDCGGVMEGHGTATKLKSGDLNH